MTATETVTPSETATSTEIVRTKPRIRRIGTYRYLVESRSEPGVGRQVDTLLLKCSCPAGKHGRRCTHWVWALHLEAWRRHELAKVQAEARARKAAAKQATVSAMPVASTPALDEVAA